MKAKAEARLAEQRARLGDKTGDKRRPSRWWLLVLLLILLLLALLCCLNPCTPAPEPPPGVPVELSGPAGPTETDLPPEPPRPPLQRIPRQRRPRLDLEPPGPPSWLDAFRLQVSARSPRLAACFEGAERPGELRWTTSVEPIEGAVSDHNLEPMLDTAELTSEERTCLIGVLSRPRYDLDGMDAPETPTRVSLVIAF